MLDEVEPLISLKITLCSNCYYLNIFFQSHIMVFKSGQRGAILLQVHIFVYMCVDRDTSISSHAHQTIEKLY